MNNYDYGIRQCHVCEKSNNIYESESSMILNIEEILECSDERIEDWESKNKNISLMDWFCGNCASKFINEIEEVSNGGGGDF
tara:strand:+ start:225 stop:470 length:246 start_codon:yes stop_codon:yes gene_type:complete